MTVDKSAIEADLAFLRGLVSPGNDAAWRRAFGRQYALWGFGFLPPLALEWARMVGLIALPGWFWLAAVGVVVLIIIALSIVWTRRADRPAGTQARSANAIFGGVGWANLAVLVGLMLAANMLQDGRVMMIHAIVVFAFQGAAWYAVWAMRKIAWAGLVSAGWFVAAIASAATMGRPSFILVVGASLLLLMALPGLHMARSRA